ncbi:hypothetical protein SDC9_158647 [bioreactor metagenome]|uniref:Uncharacterized protein n=1 Tax=bioreactor metagenome TaxID=1076179 RepID=A0A645FCI4_9ZZZZ
MPCLTQIHGTVEVQAYHILVQQKMVLIIHHELYKISEILLHLSMLLRKFEAKQKLIYLLVCNNDQLKRMLQPLQNHHVSLFYHRHFFQRYYNSTRYQGFVFDKYLTWLSKLSMADCQRQCQIVILQTRVQRHSLRSFPRNHLCLQDVTQEFVHKTSLRHQY